MQSLIAMTTILIVHYNTPEVTEATIRSIEKHVGDYCLHIFDNSDERPLTYRTERIVYHDNTNGQLIDFEKLMDGFPEKLQDSVAHHGSVKHTYTIDYCFDILQDGFVLLDSDVLLKKDVTELVDKSIPYVGEVEHYHGSIAHSRVLPMVCWLNVPLLRERGIRYFDEKRSWLIVPDVLYDTGASFYEDCINSGMEGGKIKYREYAEHLGGASYNKRRDAKTWLRVNQKLYE